MTSTQTQIETEKDVVKFLDGTIYCEEPNKQIYDFKGVFKKEGQNDEPLNLDQTMWFNTVLASQSPTIGIVVYTGTDTRAAKNQREASTKMCLLDEEVNYLSKILFCFLLGLSFLITALNGFHGHWQMFFFRIMLLMSSIIPISVRINLDLAKLWYCHGINHDDQIPGVIARNSNIPEELGRIQFLISDKTGTLTQNDMITRKIFTEYNQLSYKDNRQDMLDLIQQSCTQYPEGCAPDYFEVDGKMKTKRREQSEILRDMITALAVCNNVTPVAEAEPIESGFDKQARESNARRLSMVEYAQEKEPQLEASSPDEVALVKFGYLLRMKLLERERTYCTMQDIMGNIEEFEILRSFPFTSESKKMGCLLKSKNTGRYIYYLKGAEVVLEKKIKAGSKASLLESCENLAMDGLRTLVFAQKVLTKEQADDFITKIKKAEGKLRDREKHILKVQNDLEHDMDFLGVTGVEDKLQENVEMTIESLKAAGI